MGAGEQYIAPPPHGEVISNMSLIYDAVDGAELVFTAGEEYAGGINPYTLYGIPVWLATSYIGEDKLYTSREEAIAWLVYGVT